MAFSQRGQRDPGETTERPSGMREIQTFRKLPITMPKRKKKIGITQMTVPQPSGRLNAWRTAACRMANGTANCSTVDLRDLGEGETFVRLIAYGDERVRALDPALRTPAMDNRRQPHGSAV